MDKLNDFKVKKTILYPGKLNEDLDFPDGSKVTFHVKTEAVDEEIVYDDSRKWGKPVELLLGKKFKLEIWEVCIKTMLKGEIATFTVDKSICCQYPIVSKTLREAYNSKGDKPKEPKPHCCGMGFKEGLGHPDLDKLMNNPTDLKFTIELLSIEIAGSYEKEFWAMNEEERVGSISILRNEGNDLFKSGQHELASKKYSEALGRLEQLMLREKPNDTEWNALNDMKLPLLLNYSQCEHIKGNHYSVVEHCSTVLESEPDNVKALFRRGRAHVNVFNPKEARCDIEKAMKLDSSITSSCKKLLGQLADAEKERDQKDKNIYKNLFS